MTVKNKNFKRMTWKEIVSSYPESLVGLSDIKWETDEPDCPNVESAVVAYTGDSYKELLKLQIDTNSEVIVMNTSQKVTLNVGVIQ